VSCLVVPLFALFYRCSSCCQATTTGHVLPLTMHGYCQMFQIQMPHSWTLVIRVSYQNCIHTPHVTVSMEISLLITPCIHRQYLHLFGYSQPYKLCSSVFVWWRSNTCEPVLGECVIKTENRTKCLRK
jgi:hypothetical protein